MNTTANLSKNLTKEDLIKDFDMTNCLVERMEVPCFVDMNKVPKKDPNNVFDEKVLNQVLLFLSDPCNDCLFLSGESGCGKTSIILQTASRLGYAVEQVTCSAKTEIQDLIGHQVIKKGTLSYEYGVLTNAMKDGEILLINEIDMLNAGELSGLNDLLEGKPLTIIQNNGEVIYPHPNFRVIATGNTKGNGDSTGLYLGARVLNKAFLDRFRFIDCNYPSVEAEKSILSKSCPKIKDEDLNLFVQFADKVRSLNGLSDDNSRDLSYPFTTRTLLRVAKLYSNVESYSVNEAVTFGFSSRLPSVEKDFIDRLVCEIFGYEHKKELINAHEVVNKVLKTEKSKKRA